MKTTLNKIKAAGACEDRYKHLLTALGKTAADDEPLEISKIIETNGIEDAVWALCAVDGHDLEIRLFACDCAEMVLPIYEHKYPGDDRPRKAIEVIRLYANGKATEDERASACDAACDAAWDAIGTVAWYAAGAAAWVAAGAAACAAAGTSAGAAAWAAAWAAAGASARAAAWDAAWAKIKELLEKYLKP